MPDNIKTKNPSKIAEEKLKDKDKKNEKELNNDQEDELQEIPEELIERKNTILIEAAEHNKINEDVVKDVIDENDNQKNRQRQPSIEKQIVVEQKEDDTTVETTTKEFKQVRPLTIMDRLVEFLFGPEASGAFTKVDEKKEVKQKHDKEDHDEAKSSDLFLNPFEQEGKWQKMVTERRQVAAERDGNDSGRSA